MRCVTSAALLIVTSLVLFGGRQTAQSQTPPHAQLVIVVDGLRPDDVTAEVMPRLAALGRRGVVFNAHHSVFPTVTRVNASSMVTGVYPEGHGLLGNTIYVPAVNATRGLDTGSREVLESVARASGRLLTAPTLGELMQRAGKKLMTAGSGSSGALFLLDATGAGVAAHQDYSRPPAIGSRLSDTLGSPPAHATPNAALNKRAFDAYLTLGLDEIHPDVTFLWISDPDTTAHAKGTGTVVTRESLKLVDAEIGRVEDTLRARALLDRTNMMVVSDHGFSTHTGELKLEALVAPFAKMLPDGSRDIVVAEGSINFRTSADAPRVSAIVAALQKRAEVGAIFTRPSGRGVEGVVPGTLSFDVARWNHARAGEVLVAANWTDRANDAGRRGTSTQTGVAGHGTSSPFDVHATLIAAGPDFKEHATSEAPTGNVDIAPTLLRLLGLPVPQAMTGRVIEEGLRAGPSPAGLRVDTSAETVRTADNSYRLTAHVSAVSGRRYLDFTDVSRNSAGSAQPEK
jgi:predicted AlkP superfamily pyrophosphatase or phosphodiesterase